MTTEATPEPSFRVNRRLLLGGGMLVGVGTMARLLGLAVTAAAVATGARRYMRELDMPPREMARRHWVQAKSTAAGAYARLNSTPRSATARAAVPVGVAD